MKQAKVAIGIATAGRADVLSDTLDHLMAQTRTPSEILVCPASEKDVNLERLEGISPAVKIVRGERGLPAQRNAIINACDADILIFFDDDFLPANDYLQETGRLFQSNPDVVVATGYVLADGILTEGLEFDEGKRILEEADANSEAITEEIVETFGAYGCNMVIRLEQVRRHSLMFDEELPLYAWFEDLDFSRQLARYGRVTRSSLLRGVHLGTKRTGRSPGMRLGYSQVANPIYLARKGTMEWTRALKYTSRNVLANCFRILNPEPWVDRKGRFFGNVLALRDTCLGKLHPKRILEFK